MTDSEKPPAAALRRRAEPDGAELDAETIAGDSETPTTEAAESLDVQRHDDGSATVRLFRPFEHGKKRITELRLRDVFAKDMRAMDRAIGQVGKRLALMSTLSGLSGAALDKLHASDFSRISDVLDDCLEKSPASGGTG